MNVSVANRNIGDLKPLAQTACKLFLEECSKQNVKVFVTETYRSQARQNYLYEQGRTRKGNIVTWTKNSNHTGRMAWDIAISPPKDLYDINELTRAGKIAKELGITWGGTWKAPNTDTPHFEITSNWKPPTDKGGYKVKKIKINLNGKIKEVDAVNIDGHNYVKLQDLRDSKISIGYDGVPIVKVVG